MKTTTRLLLAAAFALVFAGVARAADVTGKWKAEFDTQIGVQKYVFDFKADGEKLTGTAVGDRGGEKAEVKLTEGKIVKDAIAFVELLNFQGQDIRVEYKGKMTGDDEIKLTRQVGDVATEELVAKRVKEK